jgi:ribosomal protein S18 acetylase RimI-like enzyme
MIIIEQATTEDVSQIAALAKVVWWAHFPGIISKEQVEYMLARWYTEEAIAQDMESGRVKYLKLLVDGQLIAFASYGPGGVANEMQLHRLYVHPHFQRRGYGSAMIRHVEERANQAGCRTLLLTVNKNNKGAISNYHKNGYKIRRSTKVDIGGGFYMDDYHMTKKL